MTNDFDFFKLLLGSPEEDVSYGKFVDLFPAIVYIYNVNDGRLIYSNSKLQELLGYHYDEIKNNEYNNLVYPDDIDLVKKELQKFQLLEDDNSYCYNCRLNHKKGYWRHFRTLGSVLKRDIDGKPASILFIAQDVTDQLKDEQELKALNDLLVETEELLHFGSWSWDFKTNEFAFTSGLSKVLETAPKRNMAWEDYLSFAEPEYQPHLRAKVVSAIDAKEGFEYDYEIRTEKGNTKFVSTKTKLIKNDTGQAVKMIGITLDVTAKKNSERERERIIRELRRSNKELEEFAYAASHDLQEPLRKIITFSERLRTKCSTGIGVEGIAYLDRIVASTENMRLLIDNLLEFSRITRSSYAYQSVDLNNIIDDVLEELELKAKETNAAIKVSRLPSLQAVPSEMKQLFTNLVSNALKFRKPDAPPAIEIASSAVTKSEMEKLHLPSGKDFVRITVRDYGIGFEDAYATQIFQIFQRLHGKSEYPGSGIGLAICKKIVDNHSGLLYAEGNPGTGAHFHVVLPTQQNQ